MTALGGKKQQSDRGRRGKKKNSTLLSLDLLTHSKTPKKQKNANHRPHAAAASNRPAIYDELEEDDKDRAAAAGRRINGGSDR